MGLPSLVLYECLMTNVVLKHRRNNVINVRYVISSTQHAIIQTYVLFKRHESFMDEDGWFVVEKKFYSHTETNIKYACMCIVCSTWNYI